jgi:prepilin-type N-terminal cleavage/methylation domain-containing protein
MDNDTRALNSSQGFTLIELMIVTVIIGILVTIAVPNFIHMQDRAREAAVRSNMHALQTAIEDFAVQTLGFYPDDATSTTPGGLTVADLCPGADYPDNPFTGGPTAVNWDADPAAAGEIGVNPAVTDGYIIKGFGKEAILAFTLNEGM